MLLRTRTPALDTRPALLRPGLEHLDQASVAVLRWLNSNKIDFVLVGPVARAIRGETAARGPVTIIPAPYSRNWDRLASALSAQQASLRSDRAHGGPPEPIQLDGDKLARGRRWLLRFAGYDLDIEGLARPHQTGGVDGPTEAPGGVRYQELIYESARFEVADGVVAEVAAPEDLEDFSHVRRTGTAPEFRITRNGPDQASRPAPDPADTREP